MVSAAGLSATYGGYQAGRQMDQQIQQNDQKLLAGDIEQQGTEALGRAIQAFQAQIPGSQPMQGQQAGPTPPMPGQPSVPNAPMSQPQQSPAMIGPPPPMQQGGGMPPQAPSMGPQGPSSPPNAAGAPAPGGGLAALQGKLDLKTLMGAISQANPGAKPAVIASAVTKALPLLTAQAQMDWKQMSLALAGGRLENAKEGTAIRRDNTDSAIERREAQTEQGAARVANQTQDVGSRVTRREAQTEQGDRRLGQIDAREARIAASNAVRADQRWQQLEQQKTALQERIRSGGAREGLSQWRATLDAQHKRAMEIIQANSINSNMRPEEKKALLEEQNRAYEDAIKNMKPGAQTAPGADGSKDQGRAPKGAAIGAPPAEAPAAPQRTQFKNKQTGLNEDFELINGQWVPLQQPAQAAVQ